MNSPVKVTDLKELLDERTVHQPPALPLDARLAGVRSKVNAGRRRTAGLAALAVLATAGAGVGVGVAAWPTAPTPTRPPNVAGEFPEYVLGTRIVSETTLTLPALTVTAPYDESAPSVTVILRCPDVPELVYVRTEVTAYGRTEELPCGRGTVTESFAGTGTTTVSLAVIGAANPVDGSPVDIPSTGRVILALAAPVPFDDYPLPDPPSVLAPLGDPLPCPSAECVLRLESDRGDPTATVTQTLTWSPVAGISTLVNTPGILHVQINGVEVATESVWDYTVTSHTFRNLALPGVTPGDPVTVEISAEHVTGSWRVELLTDAALS